MPADIWITDTSFRDGQQSMNPYTPEQIEHLFKLLSKLGGPYGLIRQTEFFIYSKRDREAIERCQALGLRFPEITTWIRATREDFRMVKDLGIKETGILVSCSDYHIFKKMQMTRRQALDYYLATVKDAFEAGVMPRRSPSASGPAIPWATASPIPKWPCPAVSPVLSTACSTIPAWKANIWNGTATTTSIKLFPTPPPHGCTAPAA